LAHFFFYLSLSFFFWSIVYTKIVSSVDSSFGCLPYPLYHFLQYHLCSFLLPLLNSYVFGSYGWKSSGGIFTTSLLVKVLEGRKLGIPEDTSASFHDCSSLMRPYHTGGGQNNGNTRKLRNRICLCWLHWKNFSWQHWMFFFHLFTLCSACVSVLGIVLSDSPCGKIGKWATFPILKEDRLLLFV
jgi:hypothetical protein